MNRKLKIILGDNILVPLRCISINRKNPQIRKLIERNKEFKNIHKGKRCFVLGNGPSLKNLNFSRLKNEIVFTVNQLPRNKAYPELYSNYHFWTDEVFYKISDKPQDRELLSIHRSVKTETNSPIVFYRATAKSMLEQFGLVNDLNIRYFMDVWYDDNNNIRQANIDYTKMIPLFPSVVNYAICLAVYMGICEIYLLGCDCTGFLTMGETSLKKAENSQYAYEISKNEKKRMEQAMERKTIYGELRWHADVFEIYEILDEYCRKNGAKLFNATSGGLLNSLPRINLDDIL